MASDHEDSRRRPQPIDVPGFTYPASASSAPNDFGVAAQSERSVNPKQQEQNGLQSPTVRLPRSTSTKSASSKNRDPESTTVTGLMDRARGLSVPATSRRHRATQSSPTTALTGMQSAQLFDVKEDARTGRAKLEAETEQKYHKMMGQIPNTPVKDTQHSGSDLHYQINDLRPRVSTVSKSSTSESSDRAKSPKKKFFGVSLPSFKVPSNLNSITPPPALPGKVAKLLGSSPPPTKTRNRFPYSNRSLPSSAASRSTNISKVIPSNAYRQHAQYHRSYHRRPIIHPGDSSYPRRRASSGRPPIKDRGSAEHTPKASHVDTSSSESVAAPTPPQKDTPPGAGFASAVQQISSMVNTVPDEPAPKREKPDDHGMRLHTPTLFALDPNYKPQPGYSPTKYYPWGVEEYAKIVERERIKSAYGAVDGGSIKSTSEPSQHTGPYEEAGHANIMASLDKPHLQRSRKPTGPLFFKVEAEASSPPDYLPATTYQLSPASLADFARSKMGVDRLSPVVSSSGTTTDSSLSNARGLIDTLPQERVPPQAPTAATPMTNSDSASPHRVEHHSASEIAHHDKHEFRLTHPHLSRFKVDDCGIQPENSSSHLTDMLSAVSPSKIQFHELRPQSAVPSPLHRNGFQPRCDFEPTRAKGSRSAALDKLGNANDFSQPHSMISDMENTGERRNNSQLQFIHRGVNEAMSTSPTMAKMRQTADGPHVQSPTRDPPETGQAITAYEHMEPVASSQHDKSFKRPSVRAEDPFLSESRYSTMLADRVAVMESHFESLRSQLQSDSAKGHRDSSQMAKLTWQLDEISEYIKSDIAEPLHDHIHRCVYMEHDIKELRRTLEELQQTMERRTAFSTMHPAFQSTSSSPFHRHQPSRTGYYNTGSRSADTKIQSVWDQ